MDQPVFLSVVDATKFTMRPAPEDGRTAWLSLEDTVDARIGTPVTWVNTELQESAERAIEVLDTLHDDPVLYEQFKLLGSVKLFDLGTLRRAQTIAWALWHARHQQKVDELAPEWKVEESTVEEANTLRAKMARLAGYHLEGHREEGPRVQGVTADQDRRKLANDLELLAGVYERQEELLSSDRYYEPGSISRARALSVTILRALGQTERARWTARCAVLWTMLLTEYREVRDTGRWLLRARPSEALARFPGLVPQRKKSSAKGGGEGEGEGAPEASDEAGEGEETAEATEVPSGADATVMGSVGVEAPAGAGAVAAKPAETKTAGAGAKTAVGAKKATGAKQPTRAASPTKTTKRGQARAAAKKR